MKLALVPRSLVGRMTALLGIALAVALTGIAVWQLPPLVIPALGCLAFAAAVVGVRRRRPEEEAPAEHR